MKKLAIIFLLLLIAYSSAVAQTMFATDRGSLSLGGSIYLSSGGGDALEDSDGNRSFDFSFNPDFLIFVVPSLAVGAELNFSSSSQGDYSNNAFGIGPEVIYFIAGHKDQNLYPYIGMSFLFRTYSYKYTSSDVSGDSRSTTSKIKAGLMIMLSDAVALNTEFNYRSHTFGIGDEPESGNVLYFGFGIKAFIF